MRLIAFSPLPWCSFMIDCAVSIWLWNVIGRLSCQWSVWIGSSRNVVVWWNSIWTHINHSPGLKHPSSTTPFVHAAAWTAQTTDTTDYKRDNQESNDQRYQNTQWCNCKFENVATVHFTLSIQAAVFIIRIVNKRSGTRMDEFINYVFTCAQCAIHSVNSIESLE